MIEIKNRYTGDVIFVAEDAETLRDAVLAAIAAGANLYDANLENVNLNFIRDDFWAVLSAAPAEAPGVRAALLEGRVDGSTYEGACACLVGTVANLRGVDYRSLGALQPNAGRPIERWFAAIKKGDTPDNNTYAKQALVWLDEWLHNVQMAFDPVYRATHQTATGDVDVLEGGA